MKVYKLTDEQAAQWAGKYGIHEFKPMRDADNNWVAGLANSDNLAFPFRDALKLCPKINYAPKTVKSLPKE